MELTVRVKTGNMGRNGENGDQGQGRSSKMEKGAKVKTRNKNVIENNTGLYKQKWNKGDEARPWELGVEE